MINVRRRGRVNGEPEGGEDNRVKQRGGRKCMRVEGKIKRS